jgi:DNA mismatch repair protein MutL
VLGRLEDPSAIHAIIADLLSDTGKHGPGSRDDLNKVIACRGALKAGTVCTEDQCRRLVEQLQHTKNPFTCPHGRPTIVSITKERLDVMFRRI